MSNRNKKQAQLARRLKSLAAQGVLSESPLNKTAPMPVKEVKLNLADSILVRLSVDQKKIIADAASQRGLSASAYIRYCALKEAAKEK